MLKILFLLKKKDINKSNFYCDYFNDERKKKE